MRRSPWARDADASHPREISGSGAGVVTPTDSLVRLYLMASESVSISGLARPTFLNEDKAGGIDAEAGVTLGNGRQQTLFRTSFRPGSDAPQHFDVTLPIDEQGVVAVSLRTIGSINGSIHWDGVEIRLPSPASQDPGLEIANLMEPAATGRLGRPDIFLILLDAARADAWSSYGGPYPTPAVDSIAAAGTRFEQAYSAASWTAQSIPSLLTGRYPESHGVDTWGIALPESIPLIAQLLQEQGYFTSVWSQHPIYDGNPTLSRGFEQIHREPDPSIHPMASALIDPDRPSFALIHLLRPHGLAGTGYVPPPPFRGIHTGSHVNRPDFVRRLLESKHRRKPAAADLRRYRDLYQENVSFADHLVGGLIDSLRAAGRYDDALVFVTSDHGEAFWEHKRFFHAGHIYEELMRVPLIVKWPAGSGRFPEVVPGPVSNIDIAPTIVDAVEHLESRPGFQGRSLLPAASSGSSSDRMIYLSTYRYRGKPPTWVRGLRYGQWKLIDGEKFRRELYDLEADPMEQEDLSDARPLMTGYLLQQLKLQRRYNEALTGSSEREVLPMDEEQLQRLRDLGYLQ